MIVAERRRLGGPSELVVVDAATGTTRTIVSTTAGRNVDPVWTPDGRTVLFASDRDGAPFAIHAVDVATGAIRQLRGTGPSAQSPALSPDGATLVYAGYSEQGYDLFSLPTASATWIDVTPSAPPAIASVPLTPVEETVPEVTPYRPWGTLLPQFWLPVVESNDGEITAGAGTAGADALGRHAYGVSAAWAASRVRPDWTIAYAYDRWWPTLFASLSDDTDPWRIGRRRTREVNAGAVFPVRRVRWTQSVITAFNGSREAFDCASCAPAIDAVVNRQSIRVGWSFDNSKAYGYSISRETGASLVVTSESTQPALRFAGHASAATVDARLYRPVAPRHAVIAVRVAVARASGAAALRRTFNAGGAGPQPGGFRFGGDAIGLMRGFSASSLTGDRVVVSNLDYRVPLVRVQRGVGTLPFFVRTVHAAAFADAGHAWSDRYRWADLRRSFGAELSLDTVIGYALPLTLSAGAAWRHDPSGTQGGVVTFGRIGRAF
jgi:hypothetical protein